MQKTIKAQVLARKSAHYDAPIKGAIGYTLPNKPSQALTLMKQQDQRQICKQIMFIPFPQIRNVIVTFMRPYPLIEKDYSEILKTEYEKNKILQKLDNSINQKISKAYHQKIKLQKILRCFQKAQKLKKQVNQLRDIIRSGSRDDLGQKIKQIQSQADSKKSKLSNEDQKMKIQDQKNQYIIQQFEKRENEYEKKNNHFIKLNFTYSQVKEFCKQMQKIIPIIWRQEDVPQSKQSIRAQNFIAYFQLTILQQQKQLMKFINQSGVWLQIFRKNVKTQSWIQSDDSEDYKLSQNQLKQLNSLYEKSQQDIKLKVYQKLKEITKLDEHIVEDIDYKIKQNLSDYQKFVTTYTDIKEVCNSKNKWKDFLRIISEQEKLLSEHMRINCGLVVFYKPTEEYEQFTNTLNKRKYVEQIFNKRLTPIQDALKFINEQHNLMYKKACEDPKSGSKLRKDEVQKKLTLFQKNTQALQKLKDNLQVGQQTHFQYMTHLVMSLNRLMALAK